jgi:L-ribulose-5-phosphate 3-epimerase
MDISQKIGFMQGRLSPLINGRIQAFPWENWKEEFPTAQRIDIHLMEWTLDQERLYENPLLTEAGQEAIRALCQCYELSIPSLTGDCFMQVPFWKSAGKQLIALERDFLEIAKGCASVGIFMMVVPLVDNGRLENMEQENTLIDFLSAHAKFLESNHLKVIFESDFAPYELARFISRLDPTLFGINYDIGNSAALGFNPAEEIAAYGTRVDNVHVKDRKLGGTTVPLGSGNADFETVLASLAKVGFNGNFILQTARATNGDHARVLSSYRDMTVGWLNKYAA